MADRRIRDLQRLLEAIAITYGATVAIEQTRGGHLKGTFAAAGRQAFIITGLSPSDWRVGRKVKNQAHRTLRALTAVSP